MWSSFKLIVRYGDIDRLSLKNTNRIFCGNCQIISGWLTHLIITIFFIMSRFKEYNMWLMSISNLISFPYKIFWNGLFYIQDSCTRRFTLTLFEFALMLVIFTMYVTGLRPAYIFPKSSALKYRKIAFLVLKLDVVNEIG